MKHANDNAPVAGATCATGGLRFLSVCSGIEAASVAWHPLGWKAVAFSEIEKFPSAVLAHHYPDVPNLGDFTKIDTTTLGQVDILCGGTPCQAFSVAGLRGGLNDARGNLTLAFVELAHALSAGNGLRNVVWENVVGVLSDRTNAFGCFLAGLVGADDPIVPPNGRKWTRHGMVAGPKGRAAWAVKDAQFFGVAQRRRRVLVVADFGNGADPSEILFEPESLLRYPEARREARKDVARATAGGTGVGGEYVGGIDYEGNGHGPDVPTGPLLKGSPTGGGHPLPAVAYSIQAGALRTNPNSGPDGVGVQSGVAYTLEARAEVQAVAWSIMPQNSGKDYKARQVDVAQPLMAGGPVGGNQGGDFIQQPVYAPEIARCVATREGSSQDYETTTMVAVGVTGETSHALTAEGADASEDGTGRGTPVIAQSVAIRGREGGATAELGGPVATALRASQGGGDKPHVLAWQPGNVTRGAGSAPNEDVFPTLKSDHGRGVSDQMPHVMVTSAVRRLTPVECERLMGFPDDYTAIPWRGKPASECPDGPRYKALGNSWAVPKFTWLGRRLQAALARREKEQIKNAA